MKVTLFVDEHKNIHTYDELADEIDKNCKYDIFDDFLSDNIGVDDLYDIFINGNTVDFEIFRHNWETYYTEKVHQIIEEDYYAQVVDV